MGLAGAGVTDRTQWQAVLDPLAVKSLVLLRAPDGVCGERGRSSVPISGLVFVMVVRRQRAKISRPR